jgi:hypothetical protein
MAKLPEPTASGSTGDRAGIEFGTKVLAKKRREAKRKCRHAEVTRDDSDQVCEREA